MGRNIECFCSETKSIVRSKLASDASDNIVSVGNRRVRIYEKLKIIKIINLRTAVIIIIF